eukprot:1408639-Amphidinium_carterae.1
MHLTKVALQSLTKATSADPCRYYSGKTAQTDDLFTVWIQFKATLRLPATGDQGRARTGGGLLALRLRGLHGKCLLGSVQILAELLIPKLLEATALPAPLALGSLVSCWGPWFSPG